MTGYAATAFLALLHQIADAPEPIRSTGRQSRRRTVQSPGLPDEVVVGEVQRTGSPEIFELPGEASRQPGEPPLHRAHGPVAPLDPAGADLVPLGLAADDPLRHRFDARRSVPTAPRVGALVDLRALRVVDRAEGFLDGVLVALPGVGEDLRPAAVERALELAQEVQRGL